MPGIVAGTLLTFIPAAGDYVNARAARADTSTRWSATSSRASSSGPRRYPAAAALSFILMAAILVWS